MHNGGVSRGEGVLKKRKPQNFHPQNLWFMTFHLDTMDHPKVMIKHPLLRPHIWDLQAVRFSLNYRSDSHVKMIDNKIIPYTKKGLDLRIKKIRSQIFLNPLAEKMCFGLFTNYPAVHNGGVSRGRVSGYGCWR